jgi:hypothetical protein
MRAGSLGSPVQEEDQMVISKMRALVVAAVLAAAALAVGVAGASTTSVTITTPKARTFH